MVEVVEGLPSVLHFIKTTSMVAHAFNLSSWEAGTGQLLEF